MLCAICHTTNLAPYGVNYVRCGSCSTISQVSHAYSHDRLMTAPSSSQTMQPCPQKQPLSSTIQPETSGATHSTSSMTSEQQHLMQPSPDVVQSPTPQPSEREATDQYATYPQDVSSINVGCNAYSETG